MNIRLKICKIIRYHFGDYAHLLILMIYFTPKILKDKIINTLERSKRKLSCSSFVYYASICLEGLRKTTKESLP